MNTWRKTVPISLDVEFIVFSILPWRLLNSESDVKAFFICEISSNIFNTSDVPNNDEVLFVVKNCDICCIESARVTPEEDND